MINHVSELPSRTTLSRGALEEVYIAMKDNIKAILKMSPNTISISFDLWTDNYRRLPYIGFTLHMIDSKFKLTNLTLGVECIPEKHTGENIKLRLHEVLDSFDLLDKKLIAVHDCGANIMKACRLARFESFPCVGHILHNLVVTDGLPSSPVLLELVARCKAIVKSLAFRMHDLKDEAHKDYVEVLSAINEVNESLLMDTAHPFMLDHDYSATGNTSAKPFGFTTLKQDTPTRWHSILALLNSVRKNRKAVDRLLARLNKDELILDNEEWVQVDELYLFLKSFKSAVDVLSGSKYPTINLALLYRSELKSILTDLEDESESIRMMKEKMKMKLETRFPIGDLVVTAALLDPRMKNLNDVNYYLETKAQNKQEFLVEMVKKYITTPTTDNAGIAPSTSSIYIHSPSAADDDTSSTLSTLHNLAQRHSSESPDLASYSEIVAEIQILLSFPPSVVKKNVLHFWKKNSLTLPWLSSLAREILCVPSTSTPAERLFSTAGLTVTAKRSSLHPSTVKRVVFIHDNYTICKES